MVVRKCVHEVMVVVVVAAATWYQCECGGVARKWKDVRIRKKGRRGSDHDTQNQVFTNDGQELEQKGNITHQSRIKGDATSIPAIRFFIIHRFRAPVR